MQDYIKLSRSILEWEWYTDINTKVLFIHMLLKANWKDGNFQGIEVKRGAFISSYEKLAEETKLTIREIRTAISHLKTTGEVTSKSTSKYTVFTVVNYDLYQSNDMQNDMQATSERQTNDKRTTTIEEGKKERRKEKNKKNIVEPAASTAKQFGEFESQCVETLIQSCLLEFPNSKVPSTQTEKEGWAVEIERMKRIDCRTEAEITEALTYATMDSFWKANIRSAKKLREKFETLLIQSRAKGIQKKGNHESIPKQEDRFHTLAPEVRKELESLGIIEGQSLNLGNATEDIIALLRKEGIL